MWALIMAAVAAAALGGLFYLITRIQKFAWIGYLAKGRKKRRFLISAVLCVAVTVFLGRLWGTINAMICVIHLLVFFLLSEGITAICEKCRGRKCRRYYAGGIAVAAACLYLASGWYGAHYVRQTDYVIQTPKKVGTIRIALFADSHTGTTFHGEGFAEHMRKIQEQKPDVVLVVGDFVDDDTSKEDMIACCQALGEMQTTYGVYYVFGNHDKGYYPDEYRGYGEAELVAELQKNHVTVLQDEHVQIDDRFYIIGRQDHSVDMMGGNGRASMEELMQDVDRDCFSIVLDHQPADYAAQAASGADLVVSGHTHGGQLFPLMNLEEWLGFTPDDKVYGYEKRDATNFVVTSGISDWAIKFKTGCYSEYVMIEVQGQ